MNDFSRHIPAAAADTTLTAAERERMRRAVYGYMALKPLRPRTAPAVRGWHSLLAHPALAALGVVAILGSSTGISYASESALPGDLLYPVKVRVTEPLRGALARTPEAKSEWAIEVASARATEAATLAAAGTLDEKTESELSESLIEHARVATESLAQASTSAPVASADRAARFEARLAEYERVIVAVSAEMGTRPALAAAIEDARSRVARIRDERTRTLDDDDDTAHLAIAARESVAASNRLALSAKGAFSTTTVRSIAARIESASGTVARAGAEGKPAKGKLRKAIEDTEKMRAYVETSAAIHDRTGRVITEPAEGPEPSGGAMRMAKAADAAAPAEPMLMMAAPIANDTATTSTTTASTSTDEDDDHRGKNEETEDADHDGTELTIPLPSL